jgi:hypothetical protein
VNESDKVELTKLRFRLLLFPSFLFVANVRRPYLVPRNGMGLTSSCHFSLYMSRLTTPASPPESHQIDSFVLASKEYRKRNASGAVYDDPRVAVEAGRFDEVGAAAEA